MTRWNEVIKVKDRLEKHPRDMVNIELLEVHGHYTRMGFRLQDEQDYLVIL